MLNKSGWLVTGSLLVLTACGSLPSITVDSDPPGATVRASGRDVGQTPVRISPDDVFPPRVVGSGYRAAGVLEISKPGCKSYQREVDDAVLSGDIRVKLECDPVAAVPAREAAPRSPSDADSAVPDSLAGGIRQRLEALEGLRRDKLVSDSEYQAIRKRILDGL